MSDYNNFKPDELYLVPLGGAGEFGNHLSLFGYGGKWLMVDCGLGFAGADLPGAEIVLPDPAFIAKRKHNLVGLIVTHAHEDHIGAIPYLWDRLECPVYATAFAEALIRRKMNEMGKHDIDLRPLNPGDTVKLGPFSCRTVGVTHSIPEATMVAITTDLGTIVQTGDWKLDPDPLIGETTDFTSLKALGNAGVLAVMGDSTNAELPGESGAEATVRDGLTKLFPTLTGRIAVTMMSRHIGRIKSIQQAAKASGRECALVGRSLWTMDAIARDLGYFSDIPKFLDPKEALKLPRDRVVLICTGSQAEPNAALTRISRGEHPFVDLDPGDTVVFSARIIPNNTVAIGRMQDFLIARNIRVIQKTHPGVYVSGHPYAGEVTQLYNLLKPRIAVPLYAERRHQEAHAEVARNAGVSQTIVPTNGNVVRLAPGPAEIVGDVHAGQLVVDGKSAVPDQSDRFRARRRLQFHGSALATLVIDGQNKLLTRPKLSLLGISDGEDALDDEAEAVAAIEAAYDKIPKTQRHDDAAIIEATRLAVRRVIEQVYGRKPTTEVHIVRV